MLKHRRTPGGKHWHEVVILSDGKRCGHVHHSLHDTIDCFRATPGAKTTRAVFSEPWEIKEEVPHDTTP